jgi:hypothetical protein
LNSNQNTPSNFEALWERGKKRDEKEKGEKEDIDGGAAVQLKIFPHFDSNSYLSPRCPSKR